MKRLAIIVALLCAALSFARAQNNPYNIDDTCYEYFKLAESLVADTSNDAFEIANNALLKRALEVGDEKAKTLHYVGKLKRTIRFARMMDFTAEANNKVEHQRKETQQVARETGYHQYLYYAYVLTQTYYVNTRQEIHAQSLLGEMMDVASREQNEYGIWQSSIYISQLYLRQNDLVNTRKYLRRAVNVYERTADPVIRRQSITRQCCDLASTYGTGSDSARFYIRKAEETSLTHQDTLRFMYFKAQLAAYDKRPEQYRYFRDYCKRDNTFDDVVGGGTVMLNCADAILDNAPIEQIRKLATLVVSRSSMFYLRNLAIKYDREDAAAWIGTTLILTLYNDISSLNKIKIEETTAMLSEHELLMKLDRQRSIITVLVTALIIITALALIMVALLIVKKNKTPDNQ